MKKFHQYIQEEWYETFTDGLEIFKNPSTQELKQIPNAYQQIRAVVSDIGAGDLYAWDSESDHEFVMPKLVSKGLKGWVTGYLDTQKKYFEVSDSAFWNHGYPKLGYQWTKIQHPPMDQKEVQQLRDDLQSMLNRLSSNRNLAKIGYPLFRSSAVSEQPHVAEFLEDWLDRKLASANGKLIIL